MAAIKKNEPKKKKDTDPSKRNLDELIHLHELACQKVDSAVSSIRDALQSVTALEKFSHTINDPIFYQFTKRIRLNDLFQDLNVAQLKLSSTLKRDRSLMAAHVQSVHSILESEDSNSE